VVVGIGINVSLPPYALPGVVQPYADLRTAVGYAVSRNVLVATLVSELLCVLKTFEIGDFGPFEEEWRRYDLVSGKMVELRWPGGTVIGQAKAVDPQGVIVVRVHDAIYRFSSEELSLRIKN
jgi:BirA family biotin operon repressor/biotin-[acetyl-CoA-carboxylase] ligase